MPDDALLSQTLSYSFTKNPLSITSAINKGGVITKVTQSNKYNEHNDKIETMTLQVGNVTRTVASYSYDDIGRIVSVVRSGNAGSVHYAYNIRNWQKETKSDRFLQSLCYESIKENPCFNGNISRMQWQSGKDHVLRGYDFAYDGLNRLEESAYGEGADLSQNKSRYSEHVLSYSPNGSIERLQRYGKKNNGTFGLIDDLTYSYNGNQIKAISDKAGSLLYNGSFDFKDGANADVEYFYDANGALVKDLNKGISNIEYDVLGNMKCITFSNGFKTKYIYDAAGNKLRTTHESAVTNTTDYVGNFVFEDGKLSKYLFDGGYCSFDQNQNPVFHNDYEGTSGAAAAYHELLEQNELQKYGFPTDVTSESVVKAHEYALRKEHMFLGNPKAVNLIDKDNNCIEIIDDKRTVRIPFVNFNIIRKK